MKLTAFILLVACMQVVARTEAQNVTLTLKNAPLKKVFREIQQQTGLNLLVKESLLENAGTVTLAVKDMPVAQVLSICLQNLPLSYTIESGTIIINKKEEPVVTTGPPTISGRITDAAGAPLAGATVRVEGAGVMSYQLVTDETGNFRLENVVPGKYTLTITYVGYVTQVSELNVANKNINLRLNLKRQADDLTVISVISTGYQQIAAERVTGSFDNVKKSQLAKPAANIAERLIGTTAGMEVKLDVNGNPTIQVRGKTTLYASNTGLPYSDGDNNPLIVVDGFPIKGVLSNQFGAINPNDIESITVLKDAAAASIWGARSANGVIVITTKKGSFNTPLNVEFSAFTRFSPKADVGYMMAQASSADAVAFEKMAFKKWGSYPISGSIYDNYRQSEAAIALNERNLGYLTDAQLNDRLAQLSAQNNYGQISDYLLAHNATTQYNLTLSGGGQRMNNSLSLLAEMNQSNFKGTDNKRYALNYRTTAKVFPWMDIDVSTNIQYADNRTNGTDLYEIQSLMSYEMLKNPDGSLTDIHQYNQPLMERLVPLSGFPYSFTYNPIQEIANRDRRLTSINTRAQAGLTFRIIRGLTFTSRLQYENVRTETRNYYNDQTFQVRNKVNTTSSWDQTPGGTVTPNLPLGGILDVSSSVSNAYIFRNLLNFSRVFARDHEINLVAGTEISNNTAKGIQNPTAYGYNDQTLTVGTFPNGPDGTTGWNGWSNYFPYTSSFSYATQRFYSWFVNAAYTFQGKYTVSGSYRTDASNLIAKAPKYRYSPFYSAGLGYELSKESFMQQIGWLNRLNLRATLGRTGNVDRSTSPFTLINLRSNPDPYTQQYLATVVDKGNPTLTWEKTQTLNLGIDYAVFNNKLTGKIEYYQKTGKNLLASVSVPSITGTEFAFFNNASLENKGIEITIGTSLPLSGNEVKWNGSLNFSYNKSRITKLFQTSYTSLIYGGSNAYVEGYDPNSAWAMQYAGVVDGRPKIKGPDKNTLLNLTDYQSIDGRTYLKKVGTTSPPYLLGFSNSFKIYDFNLSFIITAKFGAVFKGQSFNYPTSGSTYINNKVSQVLNADPAKIVPLPADPNDFTYYGYYNTAYLDYNYLSADLARLQEVSLSYNLPAKLLSVVNIKNTQLILQGNNLYTWLANDTGEDPEFKMRNIKPRASYTLGVKVEF